MLVWKAEQSRGGEDQALVALRDSSSFCTITSVQTLLNPSRYSMATLASIGYSSGHFGAVVPLGAGMHRAAHLCRSYRDKLKKKTAPIFKDV